MCCHLYLCSKFHLHAYIPLGSLMMSQDWLRWWLGQIWQSVILCGITMPYGKNCCQCHTTLECKTKTKRYTAHVKLIHDPNFVEAGIPGNSVFPRDSSHLEPPIYSKEKQMSYLWKLLEANIWEVNTLAPKRCGCNLKLVIFKLISRIDSLKNCTQVNATRPQRWSANTGSGNGLL